MGDYCDHDRGYRSGFGPYGGGGGGGGGGPERRQLEIVSGKEYSANQIYVTPYRPPRPRSPDHYPPPHRAKSGGSSGGGFGCFGDPEMKRRRRVASYKAYAVEGKLKASIRRGIRWIKGKCSELVHGW
ncbi:hypothetical protein Taro_017659 [Colocasia esculenta]|uniref:Uncharacterized protein n=1 Tax=Colocasia esculenta TaxID=4460 RepID=A0A843V043_COLES|nr:hypothetical protein [Colocasia esculenta]